MWQPRWMHFVKEVTGLKGFKTKTTTRTPRGTMARSVLYLSSVKPAGFDERPRASDLPIEYCENQRL